MKSLGELFHNLDGLTARQRSIAEYIIGAPDEAAYLTLKELSVKVGASEVSVLRMCRALGLESFVELKQALREYNKERLRLAAAPAFLSDAANRELADAGDMLTAVCEDDVGNIHSMINGLDREALFDCARGLLEAEQVTVFAHDASFLFADYLSYRLNFLRIKCTSIKVGDSDSIQSALARMGKNDWAVFLSFPPYHQPIESIVDFCRYRGVRMIAITDSTESPVAAEGVGVFLCRTAARYYYNSHCATVSFMNVLASCISYLLGARFDDILAEEKAVSDFIFTVHTGSRAESVKDNK